jgi:hypothetical protein
MEEREGKALHKWNIITRSRRRWESIMSKDGGKRGEVFQQKRIIRSSRRRVELSTYWMLNKNVMRPTWMACEYL